MQKTGNEHFYFDGMPVDYRLHDFWRWQASDMLNNALRGVLAEFIVAKALGVETESPRVEWTACDLLFCGYKIEVKAAAYVQSREQQNVHIPIRTLTQKTLNHTVKLKTKQRPKPQKAARSTGEKP